MARHTYEEQVMIEFDLTFRVRMRVAPNTQANEVRIFAEYVEAEIARRSMKSLETFQLKETHVHGYKK